MRKPRIPGLTAAVLAVIATAIIAYSIGKSHADSVSDDVLAELESLRASQDDAAIVKRVSQQMEDIAYQQKAVSDQERERAEQQSELALAMRDRAEQESRLAREAEIKANEAAAEAEEQRANAMAHQIEAEEQRDAANYAKSVTDTLNYRALGRTLGSSSITQYENGNKALAAQLAYASWYFLNKYEGNTYQPESFNALSLSSDTKATITTKKGGTVRALHPIYGIGCVTVTDYGEIEVLRKAGVRRVVVLQDSKYDFRDVWADSANIYALSLHGPLCKTDFTGFIQDIPLPDGHYLKMLDMDDGRILIAERTHILIMDIASGRISGQKEFDRSLSTIARDNIGVCLFFEDGTSAHMDDNMVVTPADLSDGQRVTAAYYDNKLSALFLGLANGDIFLLDRYGNKLTAIVGHVGMITDISVVGSVMVSSSYDKSVCLWNLPLLRFDDGMTLSQKLGIPVSSLGIDRDVPSDEWLTPVSLPFQAWPLALCQFSADEVAVGTAAGEIQRFNISADAMAEKLRTEGKTEMDRQDWEHYVGSAVPYIDFE